MIVANITDVLNVTELYTLKWLLLYYVNFTSTKAKERENVLQPPLSRVSLLPLPCPGLASKVFPGPATFWTFVLQPHHALNSSTSSFLIESQATFSDSFLDT